MKTNHNKVIGWSLALIAVEQLIKLIIKARFLNADVPLWAPILYFKPLFNRDYSWFNSMFQLGIGKWIHIVFVVGMLAMLILFYRFVKHRIGQSGKIDALAVFIFSGAGCSLIDKVFWGGSLDYILVDPFFTFDLKDVYINVFIGLLILFKLIQPKELKQLDENNLMKNFMQFVFRREEGKKGTGPG